MRVIVLTIFLACAALEAWLLYTISHHPAGGWGEPNRAFRLMLLYAAVPLVPAFIATLGAIRRRDAKFRSAAILAASVAGPAALGLALASYGHSMLLPMYLGFFVQLALALNALLSRGHAT